MNKFYIYVQCRPSGEPFNVGKGSGNRAYDFKNNRNKHFKNIVAKHGASNVLVYVRKCKSEAQALTHEMWMIAYGRAQGWRLCNQTMGGDGISGYRFSNKSKAVMRAKKLGKSLSTAHLENLRKACKHPEHVEKLISAGKANWADPAYRTMMHNVRWGSPEYRAKQADLCSSKEYADRQSKNSKANWNKPEFVEKQRSAHKRYWSSPAGGIQRNDKATAFKSMWNDPAYRAARTEQLSARNKRNWNNPEYRRKMIKMCIAREARKREALRQIVKTRVKQGRRDR
jgi:hypothetical protein